MDHRGGEKLYHLAPLFSIEQPPFTVITWRIQFAGLPVLRTVPRLKVAHRPSPPRTFDNQLLAIA